MPESMCDKSDSVVIVTGINDLAMSYDCYGAIERAGRYRVDVELDGRTV